MTKYKVVRTYDSRSIGEEIELTKAFDDGWEFIRASDYVPSPRAGNPGYIEYILKKEVVEE